MLLGAHILKIILLQYSSFWEFIFFQYTSLKDKNESQKELSKTQFSVSNKLFTVHLTHFCSGEKGRLQVKAERL